MSGQIEQKTSMAYEVSPHSMVARYFREAASRYDVFAGWLRDSVVELRRDYLGKAPRQHREVFSNKLMELKAFALSTHQAPPRAGASFLERYEASGLVLRPVTLVQATAGGAYEEACLSLERAAGVFKRKKAEVSLCPLAILITKHALQRLCERATVHHEEIHQFISARTEVLVERLAVVAASNLAIVEVGEQGTVITSAIPWQNGMAVVSYRVVHCAAREFDLGFVIRIPKGGMQMPYINHAYLSKDKGKTIFASIGKDQPAVFACVTTYLGASDLSEDQVEYCAHFRAFMELVGPEFSKALADDAAAGSLSHDNGSRLFEIDNPEIRRKAERLDQILTRGWLRGGERCPQAVMQEYRP